MRLALFKKGMTRVVREGIVEFIYQDQGLRRTFIACQSSIPRWLKHRMHTDYRSFAPPGLPTAFPRTSPSIIARIEGRLLYSYWNSWSIHILRYGLQHHNPNPMNIPTRAIQPIAIAVCRRHRDILWSAIYAALAVCDTVKEVKEPLSAFSDQRSATLARPLRLSYLYKILLEEG